MANMGIGILHRIMAVIAVALGIAWNGLAETVENVRGSQRENSKLVDIYYDLNDTGGGTYYVEVEVVGRTNDVNATSFSGDVGEGVAPGQNRRIVWDAGADWPGNKGDVKAVVVAIKGGKPNKVQLWEGGPYWADRNIGAENPWDYGLYFWWGDTVGHRPSGTTFDFDFGNDPAIVIMGDSELKRSGWITADGVLAPSYDTAHVKWGGSWRMPTRIEFDNLINKCDWIWTTTNGVNGYLVRGKGVYASNGIFLPLAGYGYHRTLYDRSNGVSFYWSSRADTNDNNSYYFSGGYSYNLRFNTENVVIDVVVTSRYFGMPIRPVQ